MHPRTRYPRLADAACRIYGLTICLYPAEFRHAFGHELVVTFRNRVEDVLNEGGGLDWLAFAARIAVDCIRTVCRLPLESRETGPNSLLGLSDGDTARGCIDRAPVDAPLVFALASFVMVAVGWYWSIVILPSYG